MGYGVRDMRRTQRQKTQVRAAVVAAVGVCYLGALLLTVALLLRPARLSLTIASSARDGARVAWVLPGGVLWGRGVRPGDRVLALDGQVAAPRLNGAWTGRRVRVRTAAGYTVALSAAALFDDRTTWPLLLVSPCFILLGTLVVLRAPQQAVGRAAYGLFASAAYALALAPASDRNDITATVAEWIALAFFAVYFVVFFRVFPVTRARSRAWLWLLAPPTVGITGGVAALHWPALYGAANLIRLIVLLLYLLAGLALLVSSIARRDRRPTERPGLAIIGMGTLAAILPFMALYLGRTVLGHTPLLQPEQAILALPLLPASFTYAILRHNVFDVRLFQRWLVRALLWLALLAPFVVVIRARTWPVDAWPEPGRTLILGGLFAAAATLTCGWARDHLQQGLDRLIFKDAYDYHASLQQLSQDLSLAGNLDTLGAALPATLRQLMNLDFAVLLVGDDRGVTPCGATGAAQEDLLPALVAATAGVDDAPRVVPLAFGYVCVLFVPLQTADRVVGYLCLGPKSSGEPFRAQDHDLLATLSGHLAAIVRNAQLVDDLRIKVRTLDLLNARLQQAREEEQGRLAADLHDEPLQTALSLQRDLALIDAPAGPLARSHALAGQLRALCIAMRPAALDDLGLHAAIDHVAREFSTRTGLSIILDTDPEVAEYDLSPPAQLVLYRAIQEALTNVRRHARARTVRIALCSTPDGVQLLVSDDGVGFVVPERLERLVLDEHLGLAGLYERVRHVGGRLRVTSTPRGGTAVRVDLPLAAPTTPTTPMAPA